VPTATGILVDFNGMSTENYENIFEEVLSQLSKMKDGALLITSIMRMSVGIREHLLQTMEKTQKEQL
jgi:hypothetical protein